MYILYNQITLWTNNYTLISNIITLLSEYRSKTQKKRMYDRTNVFFVKLTGFESYTKYPFGQFL